MGKVLSLGKRKNQDIKDFIEQTESFEALVCNECGGISWNIEVDGEGDSWDFISIMCDFCGFQITLDDGLSIVVDPEE